MQLLSYKTIVFLSYLPQTSNIFFLFQRSQTRSFSEYIKESQGCTECAKILSSFSVYFCTHFTAFSLHTTEVQNSIASFERLLLKKKKSVTFLKWHSQSLCVFVLTEQVPWPRRRMSGWNWKSVFPKRRIIQLIKCCVYLLLKVMLSSHLFSVFYLE